MSIIKSVFLWRFAALPPFVSPCCTEHKWRFFFISFFEATAIKPLSKVLALASAEPCVQRENGETVPLLLGWAMNSCSSGISVLITRLQIASEMHPLVIFEALLPIPYIFSKCMGWKCYCWDSSNILRFTAIMFLSLHSSTDLNCDVHIAK